MGAGGDDDVHTDNRQQTETTDTQTTDNRQQTTDAQQLPAGSRRIGRQRRETKGHAYTHTTDNQKSTQTTRLRSTPGTPVLLCQRQLTASVGHANDAVSLARLIVCLFVCLFVRS